MFIAAVFIIAKLSSQLKYPLPSELINKIWHMYTCKCNNLLLRYEKRIIGLNRKLMNLETNKVNKPD